MLRLMLLRHAKSAWDDPHQPDHDRPLNKRGTNAAPAMGRYIAKNNLVPDLILCSSATRAVQTMTLAVAEFDASPERRVLDQLYSFGGFHTPLNIIRDQAKSEKTVMLIGHNPTMEELAHELTGTGNSATRALMYEKYPTAALAVIDFDIPAWSVLQTGIGTLVSFTRPRDL